MSDILKKLLVMLAVFLAYPSVAEAEQQICHIPPGNLGNFETITVDDDEVAGHLNHGDLLGECWMDEIVRRPNGSLAFLWSCTPNSLVRLCPAKCGGGDDEFASHGPDVHVEVRLLTATDWSAGKAAADLTRVFVDFNARETTPDHTQACLQKYYDLSCRTPTGFRFDEIGSGGRSMLHYRDGDQSPDVFPGDAGSSNVQMSGTLVRRFEVMGDGPGLDVNACGPRKVYLTVDFSEIKALLVKR